MISYLLRLSGRNWAFGARPTWFGYRAATTPSYLRAWHALRKFSFRAAPVSFWLSVMMFVCFITGIMIPILPPLAALGVLGLMACVLVWVMPDLPAVPHRQLRIAFLVAIAVQFTVPIYYAIVIPGLPWISIRRVTWFLMIILAAITFAGSSEQRQKVGQAVGAAPLLSFLIFGYIVWIYFSVFTSKDWSASLKDASDATINWYFCFFACVMAINRSDDIWRVFRIMMLAAIFAGTVGIIETILHKRLFFSVLPSSLIDQLFAQNPGLIEQFNRDIVRNDLYRASYIYLTSLSFGEYLSIVSPIALAFVMHGRTWFERSAGCVGFILSLLGVLAAGTRGALLGTFVSTVLLIAVWVIRHIRAHPDSLLPAGVVIFSGSLFSGLLALALTWPRMTRMLSGGYNGSASTDARFEQWEMAKPWIMANPITGHGSGVGGQVVGYYIPGTDLPTLDSSMISVLVETGVPGFICFFGMIAVAIIIVLRVYITDLRPDAALGGALGASLTSFLVYRFVLSQRENHALLFMLLALCVVLLRSLRQSRGAGPMPGASRLAGRR